MDYREHYLCSTMNIQLRKTRKNTCSTGFIVVIVVIVVIVFHVIVVVVVVVVVVR